MADREGRGKGSAGGKVVGGAVVRKVDHGVEGSAAGVGKSMAARRVEGGVESWSGGSAGREVVGGGQGLAACWEEGLADGEGLGEGSAVGKVVGGSGTGKVDHGVEGSAAGAGKGVTAHRVEG